ncbi:MAG: 23S rRNA (guanosine(2251)-2'-O)-methyltransferase RlmB [Candidatus Rokubacteria bacterium]|nr:23S rRNA (guanosine(2251)-2'-O)-methyltransferase RlmB [Candidatus Rokubacteria bacterium]
MDTETPPLYGRHPVVEALRAENRRVEELAVLGEGRGSALQEVLSLARRLGVRVSYRTRDQLTAMAGSPDHQGVVARVASAGYRSLDELCELARAATEPAFFLAMDQVQDPRNLGAVLRSAEATGVHGVIVSRHRAVGLTGGVARSAMGALELVPVARVGNLVTALNRLKEEGVWIAGAVTTGGRPPWEQELSGPICLVFGGEGAGLRPLVARTCDHLLTLPMRGRLGSLNVSAAAAALCFEVVRQRARLSGAEKA